MRTLDYIHLDASAVSNVVASLKQLLADYQVFYTNLRGFHWNIKGHGFFVLHGKFEDMYNNAAEKVDELAERILMLGGEPENKFSEYNATAILMAQGRFGYVEGECNSLVNALCTAVWDPKELTKNVRLDDGTSDIDSLDSFEYTFERRISQLIKYG